jgi:hypothetical protein
MKRNGATLVEVLVAIFIMAIGLLTILTLFPLGAMSMAQAIQDDRAAHAAANAMALAQAMNVRNDPTVTGQDQGRDFYIHPPGKKQQAPPDGKSYPLYVDPLGVMLGSSTLGQYTGGIPRQNVSFVNNANDPHQTWRKTFSLLDDIRFVNTGQNKGLPSDTDFVDRGGKYSWAYLTRRPKASNATVVDLTIVVYSGRLLQLPLGETVYRGVTFDPTSNFVNVGWDPTKQEKPPAKKGSWIVDATLPTLSNGIPEPHGYFYRVVGVSEPSANVMVLELQTKPKSPTSGNGVLIVMENVVEVFDKGIGWLP